MHQQLIYRDQNKKRNRDDILLWDKSQHSAFFHDLLSYSMSRLGHQWTMMAMASSKRSKIFQPQIGEAILKYKTRHRIDIILQINRVRPRGRMSRVLLMLARSIFREGEFVKEFFRFCAIIVTIANYFMERDQDFQLDAILHFMDNVYDQFFKQRFMNLGGWTILEKYAVRYCVYGE